MRLLRPAARTGRFPRFGTLVKIPTQADVAQLVEQPIRNRQVIGSSPIVGSILSITCTTLLLHRQFTVT